MYECIVWCDTSKNVYGGVVVTNVSTGVYDVVFDGFTTEDTSYIPIIRGEAPNTGTERTTISNITANGFRITNKNSSNTLTNFSYFVVCVFYDPQKCICGSSTKKILGSEL